MDAEVISAALLNSAGFQQARLFSPPTASAVSHHLHSDEHITCTNEKNLLYSVDRFQGIPFHFV